jgi:hypothetical protein
MAAGLQASRRGKPDDSQCAGGAHPFALRPYLLPVQLNPRPQGSVMSTAFINRIATSVPPHDVHRAFVDFAESMMPEGTARNLFKRMARLSAIEHRYSAIPLSSL